MGTERREPFVRIDRRFCRMRRVLAFLVFCVVPAIASGQDLTSLHLGDNLRILPRSQTARIEGTLLSLDSDSVRIGWRNRLRQSVDTLSFALSSIRSLDVRRRTGGAFARSLLIGTAVGAGLGALSGAANGHRRNQDFDGPAWGGIFGGVLGFVGGMIFGGCCASDWIPIELPLTRIKQ